MPFCTKCGKQNTDTAKFCTACGATLNISVITVQTENTQLAVPEVRQIENTFIKPQPAKPRSLKNKMILTVIGGLSVIFVIAYYFFIKADPAHDGDKTASAYCDCGKKRNEERKEAYRKFITDFDTYRFRGKSEAQKKLNSLVQVSANEIRECFALNKATYEQLTQSYKPGSPEELKFINSYNERLSLCSTGDSDLQALYNHALSKANHYVGPEEKNRALMDSLAMVEVENEPPESETKPQTLSPVSPKTQTSSQTDVQSQIIASLDFAAKNLPGIERMKQDIRGKTFNVPANDLGWPGVKYYPDANFLDFKLSGSSFLRDARMYTGNIDMTTGDDVKTHCTLVGIISYTWDVNTHSWSFKTIHAQQFGKAKDASAIKTVVIEKKPEPKLIFSNILKGNWTGNIAQGRKSFTVRLMVPQGINDTKISYPSLGCSGYWTVEKTTDNTIDFREHITAGKLFCVDGGLIHLVLINNDHIEYDFIKNSKTSSSGILTRE